MKIARISVMDGDGVTVWDGTLTQFARDNSHDTAREVIAQFRVIAAEGLTEPAFIGGGAAPHFMVSLVSP